MSKKRQIRQFYSQRICMGKEIKIKKKTTIEKVSFVSL